ncbi:mitochondrial import inner membrane translocase subunit tim54 [Knufia obscura]|uniref:Mitochondrial import inner membrane translocase subunit TIM54 n=1 Tax=Knufia obscura TaxID=1635080 RepID=A0ABR0S3N7_9EURO|nr:mitochondrial import inner membrane translocase subunit tim54 [Knufia obscura]
MSEPIKQDGAPQASSTTAAAAEAPKVAKPAKPPNPVFRMMGLPNLPNKLPGRNWLIFWGVLFSFTAAKTYDSREKKKTQQKWCDLVAHIAQEKLDVRQMPRKLTVFLSAAPGDGMGSSRTYFKEYIKPILVAASMDYEVIEGRKEGDVRYGTAEQIRRLRRKKGEQATTEQEMDTAMAIDLMRERMMVEPEPGVKGDLVLGRHTWKEYIRGIHEGWLGPLDEPAEPEPISEPSPIHPPTEPRTENPEATTAPEAAEKNLADQEKPPEEKKEEEKEEKKKTYPPPAYLSIKEYSVAPLSPHIPTTLEPSEPIHMQHLLGFLKTPQRIYNWLNKRSLQDQIGRQTASIVLANYRPYQHDETFASPSQPDDAAPIATKAPENDLDSSPVQTSATYEQQSLLTEEEPYWHKSARQPPATDDKKERIWMNDIVLDPRIAERMRRFELDPEQEERLNRIAAGDESAKWAHPVQDLRSQKPIIGDIDSDSMA